MLFRSCGPVALRPLASIAEDRTLEGTIRSVAASGLEGLAVLHQEVRKDVLESLRKIAFASDESASLRSHAISLIAHFREPEDARSIKNASRAMALMSDLDTDDIDDYFKQHDDPESWKSYRVGLLEYYQ